MGLALRNDMNSQMIFQYDKVIQMSPLEYWLDRSEVWKSIEYGKGIRCSKAK